MHGEDDRAAPFADAGKMSAALGKGSVFKACPGLPHGMPTTHADLINADLLGFIRG